MIDIPNTICYKLYDQKIESRVIVTSKAGVNVNEELAQELLKLVIKKFKRKKSMLGLKIILGLLMK